MDLERILRQGGTREDHEQEKENGSPHAAIRARDVM
jgi:hypothetical protein